jgi:glucosamine--fructose-6-phosphate aminotransferase (isomerizing)
VEYAVVGAVPFQLFAYHLAVTLGFDPDYPRNLSKTLTVD